MESRIQIKADFQLGTPYISVERKSSDDVRDEVLRAFIDKLGYESRWCVIYNTQTSHENGKEYWRIIPIPPDRLEETARDMLKAAEEYRTFLDQNFQRTK